MKKTMQRLFAIAMSLCLMFTMLPMAAHGAERATYYVSVNSANPSWGALSGMGFYTPGDTVTISAIPHDGYHFYTWVVAQGTITLADQSAETTTFIMPEENVTITANLREHKYILSVDNEDGTHSGSCLFCEVKGDPQPHILGDYESGGESGHYAACTECFYQTGLEAHVYDGSADTDCNVCDHIREAHTHQWSQWKPKGNGAHYRDCTAGTCGERETENCHGGTATCKYKANCAVCDTPYGDYDPHNHQTPDGYGDPIDENTHRMICLGCDHVFVESEPHTFGDWCEEGDDQESRFCTACLYTEYRTIEPHTHQWGEYISDGKGTHTRTCNADGCGGKQQENCGEGSLSDGKCDDCGYELHSHSYTSDWTEPGCTEQGYTTYTCECGDTYVVIEGNALGHDWGEWNRILGTETHRRYCKRDSDHTEIADCALEVTAVGSKQHELTCSVCDSVFSKNHDYVAADHEGHTFACTVCGAETDNHVFEDVRPSVYNPGKYHVIYCSICGEAGDVQAEAHTFELEYDEDEHWKVCTACEYAAAKESHVYSGDSDAVCNACGYERHVHNYAAATCMVPAKCACGATTGGKDLSNHEGGTEIRNAVEATHEKKGYTGDTYCKGCGGLLKKGDVIAQLPGSAELYTIYASSGKHGRVSNENRPVYVEEGDDVEFWFYPDKGYEVSAVWVDGKRVYSYGLSDLHYWDCDGCDACWWIDWSQWYVGDFGDRTEEYFGYGWLDYQDVINFYNVHADHDLYVEFAPIDSDGGAASYYVQNHDDDVYVEFAPIDSGETRYYDLNTEAWYYEAVEFVTEKGIMEGVGGKYFDPNGTTTRGQLVTMLYRLAGEPKVSGESEFLDVPDGKWYTDAVIWATKKGIMEGYGNGYFGVNDIVTREQTVTILYRYAKYMGISVSKLADLKYFLDNEDVSDYAEEPFGWAVSRDIIEGKTVFGGMELDPQGSATRAQAATLVMRFCESETEE